MGVNREWGGGGGRWGVLGGSFLKYDVLILFYISLYTYFNLSLFCFLDIILYK